MDSERVTKTSEGKVEVKSQRPAQPSASFHPTLHPLHQLQRWLGNRAFGRFTQAKLQVSQPGDEYEQEADRIADQVMRMPVPMSPSSESPPDIQRKCDTCEKGGGSCSSCSEGDESSLQRMAIAPQITPLLQRQANVEEEDETLQIGNGPPEPSLFSPAVEDHFKGLHGGGAPLPESTRSFFEPRFGHDLSDVRIHHDLQAAEAARTVNALAFTVGRDVVFGSGQYQPTKAEGQKLLAHELAHVVQQSSPAHSPGVIMRQKGKVAQKVVGWLVKVGERKLIKTAAIYSEKELTTLLAKGYNVLVKRGNAQANRIAKKVWGENIIHHTGHIIKKTGKKGLSHFQPAKHLAGKAGEKGWHIFYGAIAAVLFFSEDVEAMEVYEDQYPGKSIANYLTVTKYVGEDSWLSYLDWINPGELIAVGGDIGRDWDRERTKELKALVFNRVTADGTVQTYELNPEGELVQVILVREDGKKKTLSADEYYTFLGKKSEEPAPEPVAQEGTKHPFYAGTFDADYRIYISKGQWSYDDKTLSFYLPANDAKALIKIGEFYVSEDLPKKYVFAFVHPRHRQVLKGPGFLVPGNEVFDYVMGDKGAFLQDTLWSSLKVAKAQQADLWQAK